MKVLQGVVLSALLVASAMSPVYADPAPLPPGKPAGTRQAALEGNGLLIALGLGAVIAFTVAIASADTNKGITTPSTTATAP